MRRLWCAVLYAEADAWMVGPGVVLRLAMALQSDELMRLAMWLLRHSRIPGHVAWRLQDRAEATG